MASVRGSGHDAGGIISGINVTPLVDVMLVLLVIFIVTAKLIVMPAVPLDLPHAAHGGETQVVFSVTLPRTGPMLADGHEIAGDGALSTLARQALDRSPDLRAVIQADGSVPHRRVVHVLDLLRGSGVTRVAFGAVLDEPESR